jgi:hypothetical protein
MTSNRQEPQHPNSQAQGNPSPDIGAPMSPELSIPDSQKIAPQRRQPRRPKGIRPTFRMLIGLTLITALLLLPFVFSDQYLDMMRSQAVDLHGVLRGGAYKQITGFLAVGLVAIEMLLTVRKRSRSWIGRIKLPGSMQLWRSLHIFLGVALVGMVLIHTVGANGFNFNAAFLWVFFGTTLTALVGVGAETGILESSRQFFGRLPGHRRPLTKGPLIRNLRAFWLASHLFFVGAFLIMLVFHIFLVYYHRGPLGLG